MRFALNLATKQHVDQRSVTLVLGSVVVVALLAVLYSGFRIADNHQSIRQAEGQLAAIAGSYQKGSGVSEAEYNALLGSIAQTNDILVRKGKEWLLVFQRLEETLPDGVAITSLEPDMKSRTLKLQGVAGSFGRLRQFVENLQGSPHLRNVVLESHTENREGEGGRTTVSFSISCGGDFL